MSFRVLLICLFLASRVAFGESCANGVPCVCTSFNLTTPNCHCGDSTGATCDPRVSSTSEYNPTNPNGTSFAQGCTASLPDHTATNQSGEVTLPSGQTFGGSFHHYGGFDSMDLSTKTGCTSGCTSSSSVPMLQASGGFMVMPALLTAQQRPTVLADASSQCPTASGILVTNYIVAAWAPGTSYVLDSKQVVMGESEIDYTNPSVTYTRNIQKLNLAGGNLGAGNGASYTCSNGTGFAAGTAGTTNQGTLVHSSDGGHANFTGDGQVILTMPQVAMPNAPVDAFVGTWSGFYYGTASGTASLTPLQMAWDTGTSRLLIYPLVDYTLDHTASGNSPSGTWLSLSVATNTPLTGAFNGTITKGAATSLYDCLYRNVGSYTKSIICVADSKAAYGNSYAGAPMTIVAVGQGGSGPAHVADHVGIPIPYCMSYLSGGVCGISCSVFPTGAFGIYQTNAPHTDPVTGLPFGTFTRTSAPFGPFTSYRVVVLAAQSVPPDPVGTYSKSFTYLWDATTYTSAGGPKPASAEDLSCTYDFVNSTSSSAIYNCDHAGGGYYFSFYEQLTPPTLNYLAASPLFARYNDRATTLSLTPYSTSDGPNVYVVPSDATASVSWAGGGPGAASFSGAANCTLDGGRASFTCTMPSLAGDSTTFDTTVSFTVTVSRVSPPLSLTFQGTIDSLTGTHFRYKADTGPQITSILPGKAYYELPVDAFIDGTGFSTHSIPQSILLSGTFTGCTASETRIECTYERTMPNPTIDVTDTWQVLNQRQSPLTDEVSNGKDFFLPEALEVWLGPADTAATCDYPGQWPPTVSPPPAPGGKIHLNPGASKRFAMALEYSDGAKVALQTATGLDIKFNMNNTPADATHSGGILTVTGNVQGTTAICLSVHNNYSAVAHAGLACMSNFGTPYDVVVGLGCPVDGAYGQLEAIYDCTCHLMPTIMPFTPFDQTLIGQIVAVPTGTADDFTAGDCAAKCASNFGAFMTVTGSTPGPTSWPGSYLCL